MQVELTYAFREHAECRVLAFSGPCLSSKTFRAFLQMSFVSRPVLILLVCTHSSCKSQLGVIDL